MINLTTRNGLLYISPPIEQFKNLLTFELKRNEQKFVERFIDGEVKQIPTGFQFTVTEQKLYWETPDRETIVTYHNLIHRVADFCQQCGWPINVIHQSEYAQPRINANTVRGLRPEQVRAFCKMVATRGGAMLNATMSTGKTHVLAAIIRAYLHVGQIVITTYKDAVVWRLVDGLNEELAADGIEVSVMTGKKRIQKSHVLVCTTGMIEHLDVERVDVILFDEVHRAAGDRTGQILAHFLKAVKYGLSGTIKKRLDGKELYLEALFGPIADEISDEEAESLDRVAKVRVFALSVPRGPDVRDIKAQHKLEEKAITLNPARNDLIRQVVQLAPVDQQLMIFVRTRDHITELTTKYIHGFEIYHADIAESEKRRIRAGIEDGTILRIISTDCLEEGVDTTELSVLIDANWTTSDRSVSQKGGRNRRKREGKRYGVIVAFQDEWCDNLRKDTIARLENMNLAVEDTLRKTDRLKQRANTRLSHYRDRNWPVERIDQPSEIEFDLGQALPEEAVQQEMF